MHGLDELQFLTQSAAATTKLARAVLSIATLNTPLIYVINYSGCHRLLKRPQEERDRLLADQKVLMPDMPGTSDSENLLKQFTILLERVLDFELVDEQVELFNFTVNIRRKLALLLELSYVEMRRAKTSKITMDHVRAAHKSKAYGEMRAQVGAIFEQAYARKMLRGRSDLWCPFGEEFNRLTPVVQAANNEKSKVVLMRLAAEQLTAREHRTVDALHAAQREARSAHPAKAAVVKLPSRRKAEIDAQTLLADTVAHRSNPPTT
jgi:hypothetical protein